ncbi:MAG: hypothetical protein ACRESI_06905 [Gammaproteobacteria bacterium]
MILDWYKYLFYRVYEWRTRRPKTIIGRPELDAATFIAVADIFYLMGLMAIVTAFSANLQHAIFYNFGEKKFVIGLAGGVVLLIHFYLYIWTGCSKKIIAEYEKSKQVFTKRGTFAVIFYMTFSYIFFIAAGILLAPSIRAHLPQF